MEDLVTAYFNTHDQPAYSHNVAINPNGLKDDVERLGHKLQDIDCLKEYYLRCNDNTTFLSILMRSNRIELLRFKDGKPIISEVKSAFEAGDYRIEITTLQLEVLSSIRNHDIDVSLIYCIALPNPRFIEIPFSSIENDLIDGYLASKKCYRMRIPQEYRNQADYTGMPNNEYQDIDSLDLILKRKYPEKVCRM